MASVPVSRLTEEQYLEIERAAQFKSEFYRGEMFAMAGGTLDHGELQAQVIFECRNRFAGRDCRAFGSDVRVRAGTSGLYTYPDISIVCGRPVCVDNHKDTITNPVVIIEVLSPTTEAYDRGKKFQLYQTIQSFIEYILISQTEMRIERFTRGENDTWTLRSYAGKDAELRIDAIDISIPLEAIYRRVEFEE